MAESPRIVASLEKLKSIMLPDVLGPKDLAPVLHRTEAGVRLLFRLGFIPAKKLRNRWYTTRVAVLSSVTPRFATLRHIPQGHQLGSTTWGR